MNVFLVYEYKNESCSFVDQKQTLRNSKKMNEKSPSDFKLPKECLDLKEKSFMIQEPTNNTNLQKKAVSGTVFARLCPRWYFDNKESYVSHRLKASEAMQLEHVASSLSPEKYQKYCLLLRELISNGNGHEILEQEKTIEPEKSGGSSLPDLKLKPSSQPLKQNSKIQFECTRCHFRGIHECFNHIKKKKEKSLLCANCHGKEKIVDKQIQKKRKSDSLDKPEKKSEKTTDEWVSLMRSNVIFETCVRLQELKKCPSNMKWYVFRFANRK